MWITKFRLFFFSNNKIHFSDHPSVTVLSFSQDQLCSSVGKMHCKACYMKQTLWMIGGSHNRVSRRKPTTMKAMLVWRFRSPFTVHDGCSLLCLPDSVSLSDGNIQQEWGSDRWLMLWFLGRIYFSFHATKKKVNVNEWIIKCNLNFFTCCMKRISPRVNLFKLHHACQRHFEKEDILSCKAIPQLVVMQQQRICWMQMKENKKK